MKGVKMCRECLENRRYLVTVRRNNVCFESGTVTADTSYGPKDLVNYLSGRDN